MLVGIFIRSRTEVVDVEHVTLTPIDGKLREMDGRSNYQPHKEHIVRVAIHTINLTRFAVLVVAVVVESVTGNGNIRGIIADDPLHLSREIWRHFVVDVSGQSHR